MDETHAISRMRRMRVSLVATGGHTDSNFDEIWITAADGSSLCAMINCDRGFLMHLRRPGDSGSTSRNPLYNGSEATTVEYRLSNGQIDEYPAAWALPIDEVRRALEYFEREGKRPSSVTWNED
jgi:hypothetical protein